MTYTLHYAPDNASLIIRLALEHRDLPYNTRLVNRAARAQDEAAYRELNPHGLIPVLETPQGPLFETAAILLWLADRHGGLGPGPEDPERGAFLKWLFYASNTTHAALRLLFYPDQMITEAACNDLRAGATRALQKSFAALEELAASDASYLAGETPSALDFYVCAMLRWAAIYPRDYDRTWHNIAAFPCLSSLTAQIDALPATASLHAAEGLGKSPFSNPEPPNPPEGSAT